MPRSVSDASRACLREEEEDEADPEGEDRREVDDHHRLLGEAQPRLPPVESGGEGSMRSDSSRLAS